MITGTGGDQNRRPLPLLIIGGFFPLLTPMPLGKAARYFRRRGRRVWILPHSLRSMRDVRVRGRLVAEAAARLLDETRADRLDILAFSMGGLAALYAIQEHGLAGRVRTLVAYAAPFQGVTSSLAALVFSAYFAKIAGQMLPGSRLIRDLLDRGLPSGPRYVSVAGANDWLCPPERAKLPGAEYAVCPFSHLDFLVNSKVYDAIEPYLR